MAVTDHTDEMIVDVTEVELESLRFEHDPVTSIHFAHHLLSLLNEMGNSYWTDASVYSPLLIRHPGLYDVAGRFLRACGGQPFFHDIRTSVKTISNYLSGLPEVSGAKRINSPNDGPFHRVRGNTILFMFPRVFYCPALRADKRKRNPTWHEVRILNAVEGAVKIVSGVEYVIDDAWYACRIA